MATSSARTKTPAGPKAAPGPGKAASAPVDAAARRGPRRAPAIARGPSGGEPDLEALRTALKTEIARHYPDADLEPVDRAFDLAVDAHEGQRRATGEPYVTHPIASAQILADLGIDPIAIEAALLHDVPEDTEYSLDRRRGTLRARGRPARRRGHQALQVQHP